MKFLSLHSTFFGTHFFNNLLHGPAQNKHALDMLPTFTNPTHTTGRSSTSQHSVFTHNPTFSVRCFKADFKFNAAHFVAYAGFREKLHGHNYSVGVELFAEANQQLGPDGYVVDFGVIKKIIRALCKSLHEHFLCPCKSAVLDITYSEDGRNLQLKCEDGAFFSFPREDCIELPLAHSTVEELASLFCGRLLHEAEDLLLSRSVQRVEVTVTEAPGQSACYSCMAPPSNSTVENNAR